jgi:hypothetical protein
MAAAALAHLRVEAIRPDGDDDARRLAGELLAGPLVPRGDLVGVHGPRAGSGRSDGEFWQADAWFLKSRAVWVFGERAAAVAALDRRFAVKRALGDLVPSRSIYAVTAGPPGAFQLWTIAPLLVTLRERLDAASAAARWDDFARALAGFGLALGEALTASLDGGLCLDASPANFAPQGGRVRYIDDDVVDRRDALGLEDAFVARFTEYPAAPAALWDDYAARFTRELDARSSPDDRARLRLAERLRAAATLRRGSAPHVERVLAALEAA